MGKFGGDYRWGGEKVACWSTKNDNVSETRKGRGKVTMEGLYRNSPMLFQSVPSPTPYGLLFSKNGGSQPHPKTQNSDRYYLRIIWQDHSQGPSEQKPVKNFREKGAWAYPGTAQFFWIPQLSQERVKQRTSNLAGTFTGFIRTKAR